jgi:hypothetical protein
VSISLVGQAGFEWPGSGTGTQTVTYASAGGHALILSIGFDTADAAPAGVLASVTDSASNTWHYSTGAASNPPYATVNVPSKTTFVNSFIAWCIGASAITSVTMTLAATGFTFPHWQGVLSEWSGIVSAGTGAQAADGATTSNVTSPPVSLAHASDLVVAHADNVSGWTSTTGTTFSHDVPNACYSLPGAAGPFSFTWVNHGTGAAVAVMSFSPVAAASRARGRASLPALTAANH